MRIYKLIRGRFTKDNKNFLRLNMSLLLKIKYNLQSTANRRHPKRWVFIACHCDGALCFANMTHTVLDSTIPILVVDYDKFEISPVFSYKLLMVFHISAELGLHDSFGV